MNVAQTIIAQLGANKFVVMTGAKNFVASKDAVHFDLPSNFAKKRINKVNIELRSDDTYTIKFYKLRALNLTMIETVENVYADTLQSIFTQVTGLDVRL